MRRPARTAVLLAAFAAVGLASIFLGESHFGTAGGWRRGSPGRVAPPHFLVAGLVVWSLLLVPAARLEGSWTRRFGALCLAGTTAGVIVQLLDDHVLNNAGTDNPLGIAIPSPYQDYLTGLALLVLAAALVGALITAPGRIAGNRRAAGR
jgi:hypothetical protein